MGTIVILKTRDGTYFIGYTTGQVEEYITKQKTSPDNEWLQTYAVSRCTYIKYFKTQQKLLNHYEYEKFRLYFRKGIYRVRTMQFSALEIHPKQQEEHDQLLKKYTDKIHVEYNEFSDRVYSDPSCNRCGRDCHYTDTCYAYSNINGEAIKAPKATQKINK